MIHIVTDSMADFTWEEAERLGVARMPMPVLFGTEECWEGKNITRAEFYQRMRTADELPKTSQVSPERFRKAFNERLETPGDTVLCITGSSKLSGCYQSAVMAREICHDPERVAVVDSLGASATQMQLVYMALTLREQAKDALALAEKIRELQSRQRAFGQAVDLKYLVMGGRLSPLVGRVGTALSIKPMLKIEGGKIDKAGMVRSAAKTKAWYVEQLKKYPPDLSVPLMVGGADCPEDVEILKEYLEQSDLELPPVLTMEIGPIIGTHVGPGLTLISWVEK